MDTSKRRAGPSSNATPSRELLDRARHGDSRALSSLFRRNSNALLRWARGRLPRWARGVTDTTDLVQDVLLQTLRRIDVFEDRGKGALQAYLRQAVDNRIRDELRRVARRPVVELTDVIGELPSGEPSPFQAVAADEQQTLYKQALATLSHDEQLLVVGRLELEYNYDQLAVISHRPSAEAARLAVRRAVIKLAQRLAAVV
jgi:RNA polymerase sigma-70 factor (ECF subfamily)